jgi:hypothetical protein
LFSFPAADWRRQILKIVLVLELVLVLRLLREIWLLNKRNIIWLSVSQRLSRVGLRVSRGCRCNALRSRARSRCKANRTRSNALFWSMWFTNMRCQQHACRIAVTHPQRRPFNLHANFERLSNFSRLDTLLERLRRVRPKQKDCLPVTRGHWRKLAFKTTWNRSGNSNTWLAIFSGSLKACLRADPDLFLPTI